MCHLKNCLISRGQDCEVIIFLGLFLWLCKSAHMVNSALCAIHTYLITPTHINTKSALSQEGAFLFYKE